MSQAELDELLVELEALRGREVDVAALLDLGEEPGLDERPSGEHHPGDRGAVLSPRAFLKGLVLPEARDVPGGNSLEIRIGCRAEPRALGDVAFFGG